MKFLNEKFIPENKYIIKKTLILFSSDTSYIMIIVKNTKKLFLVEIVSSTLQK